MRCIRQPSNRATLLLSIADVPDTSRSEHEDSRSDRSSSRLMAVRGAGGLAMDDPCLRLLRIFIDCSSSSSSESEREFQGKGVLYGRKIWSHRLGIPIYIYPACVIMQRVNRVYIMGDISRFPAIVFTLYIIYPHNML